ncbi:BadF/BadG/BcrA/BcrD ATPase family protein [Yoonia sediminilitoris]|uniref:Glucosamine kinase n=1 Tax=Yoonia sediminilitoris TaxID=1286148 RepID=A0A2T6KIS0_9RHOB|nr:BadF/BadG/BcrA/BcrD ATPase family protein [Yoonia sediminilitoris]PUB15617.1 glucosamine kinase [Yoonia sediminilitoris]RCW96226.1 glucosamine kinase [Yoonia sediminilitoris]
MTHPTQTLLVAVDGGGTGCRAAIGTAAQGILAGATGGAANVTSDARAATANIISTVNAAAAKAGVAVETLERAQAHLGLAGIMTPQDSARIAAALPYGHTTVTDDRPTALTGALGGEDGFVLAVGTGAFAAAKTDGTFRTIGGWGLQLGDQASGAWLGRAGLQQVLLCHDGLAEHTDLTLALFAMFDNDPSRVVAFGVTATPGDFGTFAPRIIADASTGDPWGRAIMKTGADHLALCLDALGFAPGDTVCLTGGVGPHYAAYLPTRVLAGQTACRGSALDGAFQLAKSALLQSSGDCQ